MTESDEVRNESLLRASHEAELQTMKVALKEMLEVAAQWRPGYQSELAGHLTRAGKVLAFVATKRAL